MKRIYNTLILNHFQDDDIMLFLTGPRQVGKTTTTKSLESLGMPFSYLNWDLDTHRSRILQGSSEVAKIAKLEEMKKDKTILIFDELHKYSRWKQFLKGFYDFYKDQTHIIVTGSAKLNTYKKGGDSLMGRYFSYRVHPLSVAELLRQNIPLSEISPPSELKREIFDQLYTFGGFPKPFEKANQNFHNRWQRLKRQQLFREDIRDLTKIEDISKIELLGELLYSQASERLNYEKLARKMQVANQTVSRWITILKSVYYCYTIQPWHKNISRALLKEPKIYLWDWSLIKDRGARAENFIANHLHKAIHFWTDTGLGEYELFYLRTIDKEEVDFLVTKNGEPWFLVEAKCSSNNSLSEYLYKYQEITGAKHAFQVVMDLEYIDRDCFEFKKPIIVPAITFLSQLV
jgi:predicted AAA+ superfamily ATPase